MPKKTIKRIKRKAKTKAVKKAKRYYRKKYSRAFRYHKKGYKKRLRRRTFKSSSSYKARDLVGIKFTRYMDLLQFLMDDKIDLVPFMASIVATACQGPGSNVRYDGNFKQDFSNFLKKAYTVFSTEVMHGDQRIMDYKNLNAAWFKWNAYSPTPSHYNLGPLFDLYSNMYKKMKYVGVKVKWIPHAKVSTQLAVPTRTEYTTKGLDFPANHVPSNSIQAIGVQSTNTTAYTLGNNINIMSAETHPSISTFQQEEGTLAGDLSYQFIETYSSFLPGFKVSPVLRLWINFAKQGYDSIQLPIPAIENQTGDYQNMNGLRFRQARILGNKGERLDMNNKCTRSFLLNKKFSFFVKPKLAKTVQEAPQNANVISNYEDYSAQQSIMARTTKEMKQVGALVQTGVKMPWLSVFQTCPLTSLDAQGANAAADVTQRRVLRGLSEDFYFDPILFSWFLTCDNIPIDKQMSLGRSFKHSNKGPEDEWYFENWDFLPYEYFRSLGRFKVTYYCKFKGIKNTNFNVPTYAEAQKNGEMEIEVES